MSGAAAVAWPRVEDPGFRRTFPRHVGYVHAVADRLIVISAPASLCPSGRAAGEPLCGTVAPLAEPDSGLFDPPVTCPACLRIAAKEGIRIGEDQR
jgi:hypothetical protein